MSVQLVAGYAQKLVAACGTTLWCGHSRKTLLPELTDPSGVGVMSVD